jgi:hypothetical protein
VVLAAEPQPVVAPVLRALIGVDQRAARLASPHRHQDRVDDDLAGQCRLHGPPDDASRIEVHHHGQVEPALPRADVGDVGHPHLIRLLDRELSLQLVRSDDRRTPGDRPRRLVAPHSTDFLGAHDARDTMTPTLLAGLSQVEEYAG